MSRSPKVEANMTEVWNCTEMFGAFILSSHLPLPPLVAFSPRASLSFLARRTCCLQVKKHLGNIQIWMFQCIACGYLQLASMNFTFTKSKVCSKSINNLHAHWQQLCHVLCKFRPFNPFRSLPCVAFLTFGLPVLYPVTSSSTVNRKSWCLWFQTPKKVIINIQANNESLLSAPWIFVSSSPWHRSFTQGPKRSSLVLQKGPNSLLFQLHYILHSSGCVPSAPALSKMTTEQSCDHLSPFV